MNVNLEKKINKYRAASILLIALLFGFLITGCVNNQSQKTAYKGEKQISNLKIYSVNSSGQNIYGVFEGPTNINVDILKKRPVYRVLILKENGLDSNYTQALYKKINQSLSKYGYKVTLVSPFADMTNSILIVPTGAMPEYILKSISGTEKIIYLGSTDMVLEKENIKSKNWTKNVPKEILDKIVIYSGTPRTVILNEKEYSEIIGDILLQKDNLILSKKIDVSQNKKTYLLYSGNQQTNYTVHIMSNTGLEGYNYSSVDFDLKTGINLFKESIIYGYSHQQTRYFIDLTNTNGTAYLYIYKDGKEIKKDELSRVKEQQLIPEILKFDNPGIYVLSVRDNDGEIKSGLIYIHNVGMEMTGIFGGVVEIHIQEDGTPIKDGVVTASLNDGKVSKNYRINKGKIYIPLQMKEGKNMLHLKYMSTKKDIPLQYAGGLIETYKTYLLPGILLVIVSFGIAYFLKRPKYYLRIPSAEVSARKTIKTSPTKLIELLPKIRLDLHLKKEDPLKIQELMFGISRHLANGYNIFEENAEGLVQKLVNGGKLISYKDYFIEKKALDKINRIENLVLRRKVREILIANGKNYKEVADGFQLQNTRIEINKIKIVKEKGIQEIAVFESLDDIHKYLKRMKNKEHARIDMAIANHKIVITTIKKLDRIL